MLKSCGALSKDTHNSDAEGAAASHKKRKRGIIKTANCYKKVWCKLTAESILTALH